MKFIRKEEWIKDPKLKSFAFVPAIKWGECKCAEDSETLVELEDHESCIVGRIGTTVCTKCSVVKYFKIIR